jgi:hypothetical protein
VSRDENGRFAPGGPGGPGRTPGARGLARKILAATNDGEELLAYALAVWRDEKRPDRERWAAYELLMDRAFGKPLQRSEIDAELHVGAAALPPNWGSLSATDRDAWLDAYEAAARSLPPAVRQ